MSRLVGLVLAVGFLSGQASPAPVAQTTPAPVSGLWHLLALNADETPLPDIHHRMNVRLWLPPQDVRAAMLHPLSMQERPFPEAAFDGRTLRIRQQPDNWLVMTWNGKRFEGASVDDQGQPKPGAQPMKLIPAK